MKFTPHAAFGKVVILAQTKAGDTRVVPIGQNGLVKTGWYYYTHGVAKVHVIETGEQLDDRTPGWLNAEHASASASTSGNLQLNFPVETEWLCIPHAYNKKGLPSLASIIVEPGKTKVLENGSDIFLVRGKLNIKGKIFTGPTQIRIRSGDVEASVEGTAACYAMRFLNED
jgi:hypothetical protein